MKKIFLILSLSIILFSQETYDRKTIQSAIFLNEVASSVNKQLPMMIDKHTRMDNVFGTEKNITYKYTLININYGDFTAKQVENSLKENIKNSVCTSPNTKIFPDNGVTMNYSYYSKKGKYITKIIITPKDCNL